MQIEFHDLVDTIQNAALDAQTTYSNWSYNTLSFDGPEYMASVWIAKAIKERLGDSGWVSLECPFDYVRHHASDKPQGRGRKRKSVSHKGKFDVVVWSDDSKPIFLVEIKLGMRSKSLMGDVERIWDITQESHKRTGSTMGGVVCILTEKTSTSKSASSLPYDYEKRRYELKMRCKALNVVKSSRDGIDCELMPVKNHALNVALEYDGFNVTDFMVDLVCIKPIYNPIVEV